MPIFWFLGTTLRPSWQVQVFSLRLHLFQLVTATNGGKKTSGIETNLKQHQPNEGSRQKKLFNVEMITVCMSCKCLFLKARFEGIEKNRNGTARSNHKQLKTFSKITREDMCNTSIGVCCVSLVMTFESCTHKLQQYFLVRTKNRSFDRVCLWGATSWGFWLELLLGNSFHPHITITSPPLFKCEITSAPRKVRIFLCQNKRKCWFHPTTVGKIARFSLMIGWYLRFFQFVLLMKSCFGAEISLQMVQFFFFLLTKYKKSKHFPLCFLTSLAELYFHSIHSLFWKTIPLSSCFLFWSFQKKERKTHSKRGWNYCSFKSFFFQQETNQKKQS